MAEPAAVGRRAPVVAAPAAAEPVLAARGLTITAAGRPILRRVELEIGRREVFGIIGPSGAGKTTLLKCLNRLVDLSEELAVAGDVLFRGRSIYAPGVDPDRLRARIGMLFQQPVVFPRSIYHNALFGLARVGGAPRREWPARVAAALAEAALWDEVKDRLDEPAAGLSAGQQQRLCLARALALEPEVILMDEPTSALDPRSTAAIEELIRRLAARRTVVLVTHNLAQARRLTDRVACLCRRDGAGEVLECAGSDALFRRPQCREVVEYLRLEEPR